MLQPEKFGGQILSPILAALPLPTFSVLVTNLKQALFGCSFFLFWGGGVGGGGRVQKRLNLELNYLEAQAYTHFKVFLKASADSASRL